MYKRQVLVKTDLQPEEKQVTKALEDYFQLQISRRIQTNQEDITEQTADSDLNLDTKSESKPESKSEQQANLGDEKP